MNVLGKARLVSGRGLTLGTVADRLAGAYGRARLVTEAGDPDGSLSYAEAAERVAHWSGAVASQAAPGDRVVIAAPNDYDFLLLCLAVARAGCVPVPVNPRMRPDEVVHVIDDSGASLVVESSEALDGHGALPGAAPAKPTDVAALFYTSGTTGKPKGARLTHRALVSQLGAAALWPSTLRRDEAVVALPIAHIMGFASLIGLAAAGIPVHLLPTFEPGAVLDALESRRATMFVGVPTMYRMLLEAGAEQRDLSSVRLWASGADVMPPDVARRFKRMGATATMLGRPVGQAAFIEGYGMVESGGGAAFRFSPPGFDLGFAGALGVPMPRYRFKVVDDAGQTMPAGTVGELWIKGPGLLEGYHGDAEASAAALTPDGWLRTGDLARRGPLGTVGFVGRSKDVLKVGGYSVYAVEVEATLEAHLAVAEAAVVGLADDRMGQVPAALVRLRPGATVEPDDLVAWAAERLASYKVPRRILAVDDLPRTGTGKVQKAGLAERFAG